MSQTEQDRAEDYLDGLLSARFAAEFERDLLEPEAAAALNEALLLRELLANLPPVTPPPGLVGRIERAMALQPLPSDYRSANKPRSSLGQILNGLSWGLRWPGYALAAVSPGSMAMKDTGLNTVTVTLGPLETPMQRGLSKLGAVQKSLWKKAAAKLWSRFLKPTAII